jgi:hypothetical protein
MKIEVSSSPLRGRAAPSQLVDRVRQRLGQLLAKRGIGLHQRVDHPLPGHPYSAGRQWSKLGDRSAVNGDAQPFTGLDPAKDLGGVISQLSHGDIARDPSIPAHPKHRST